MVKIRQVSRAGLTARFVGGRFTVTFDGITETVPIASHPADDSEIMQVLDDILGHYREIA